MNGEYGKVKAILDEVDKEVSEKLMSGYDIKEVISAYTTVTAKLISTLLLTCKVLGDDKMDIDEYVDMLTELIRSAIRKHIESGSKSIDSINGMLYN